ncbi:hypothetical protein [Streptomyces violarus]|nr:hypothetical protein [Streptomyces violarus]MCT9139747.1 hypothetical protein [Streptomyces violarus]
MPNPDRLPVPAIGTCLDPDQVRELAGLVAVIAGHSVFVSRTSSE